jgi:hypothetical protein
MKPANALLFLQTFLDDLRDRLPSCRAVLVTDADGVVLLKSVAAGAYQENSVDAMLAAMYAPFFSSLSNALSGSLKLLSPFTAPIVMLTRRPRHPSSSLG